MLQVFIIAWIAIGIVMQILWTTISIVVLGIGNDIKESFNSFLSGTVIIMTYLLGAIINIITWPIAITFDVKMLKDSFNDLTIDED